MRRLAGGGGELYSRQFSPETRRRPPRAGAAAAGSLPYAPTRTEAGPVDRYPTAPAAFAAVPVFAGFGVACGAHVTSVASTVPLSR